MGLMAHNRTDVPHTELPNREIPLPTDNIDRIEGVKNGRKFVVHFDANFPLTAAVVEVRLRLRDCNHSWIVECMLAHQAFGRLLKLRLRLNDQEEIVAGLRPNAVRNSARDHQIVTFLESERTEVGLDGSSTAVDKDQFI